MFLHTNFSHLWISTRPACAHLRSLADCQGQANFFSPSLPITIAETEVCWRNDHDKFLLGTAMTSVGRNSNSSVRIAPPPELGSENVAEEGGVCRTLLGNRVARSTTSETQRGLILSPPSHLPKAATEDIRGVPFGRLHAQAFILTNTHIFGGHPTRHGSSTTDF
jgi:hypothetical protein